MQRLMVSVVFLSLAACVTPQQRCIGSVTQNLRVVDRLIAETQGNLDRGFAYTNVLVSMPQFVDCTANPTDENPNPQPEQCLVDVPQTVSRPTAIDLNVEAAKLASLRTKRAQLDAAADPTIAACQMQYPE